MSSLREFLTSIANAIRNKKGTTAPINAQNFASEIESIETVGKSFIYKALEKKGTDWSNAFKADSSSKNIFYYMTELKESDFPPSDNVTDMSSMCVMCENLMTVPPLRTPNVTKMPSMFQNCSSLIALPRLDTSKVYDIQYMINTCRNLANIDFTTWNITSSYAFAVNCYSLTKIIIRDFKNTHLSNTAFVNCYHLDGTVNETYNPNGDKDCYIYVPRGMVDTLKSATNWSAYASQIRALENYTVDGTTDGDLDESKIGTTAVVENETLIINNASVENGMLTLDGCSVENNKLIL